MTGWRIAAGVAALTLATAAGAQQKCELNTSSPFQLRSATVYLNKLNSGKPDEAEKHARNAVQVLTKDAEKIDNQAGRNYLLGKTFVWFINRPNAQWVVPRGDVGYVTAPDQPVDLAAALDTALSALVHAKPECAASADTLRRQVWPKQINTASKFITDGTLDSADVYLTRAERLFPGAAYNQYYRAILLQKQGKPAADAFYTAYQAAAKAMESDTSSSLASIARQSLYNAGVLSLENASAADGAAKQAAMKSAIARLQEYQSKFPNSDNSVNVQSALARALASSGDTAAALGLFAKMVESPAEYTPIQLFEAAVAAVRANRQQDAIKLLEAGLERNPYHRDALFNLATLYHSTKQFDKLEPIAKRLLEVDPNNPDNFRIYAAVMQGPAEEYRAEAEKLQKDRTKRAQFEAVNKKLQAQNDSVIKYVQKSQEAPVRLTVQQMSVNKGTVTISGTIENRTDAAKSYELKFDALNAQGTSVGSGSTTVQVDPKSSKEFKIEMQGEGAIAWKYAPLM